VCLRRDPLSSQPRPPVRIEAGGVDAITDRVSVVKAAGEEDVVIYLLRAGDSIAHVKPKPAVAGGCRRACRAGSDGLDRS